ncbi:MAG: hypothetical protein ACM3IH_12205 [Sphingobacteriales bacterium]|jgi:hypothetical protein
MSAMLGGDTSYRRGPLMQQQRDGEANLCLLADRLQFTVEKIGDRFSLTRTADVAQPVREKGLTLAEAKEFLETWKLRGFHGG